MSVGSLCKTPLLLILIASTKVACTPPQPPPAAFELAAKKSTALEIITHRYSSVIWRVGWISPCIAEIFVICRRSFFPEATIPPSISPAGWPSLSFIIGCSLAALGATIRQSAYNELGSMFTFEMTLKRNHQLVKTGAYSWVRHPSYSGLALFVIGSIMCHASKGSWIRESGILSSIGYSATVLAFITHVSVLYLALFLRMGKEDLAMKELFGKEWDEWARRVDCRLIPYVY